MMFIVQRRHLTLMILLVALICTVTGASAWWYVRSERNALDSKVADIESDRDRLLGINQQVIEEREALSRRLAILERAAQVESQAYAKVDRQLEDLQAKILELKEDVAFYRGIVSEDKAGNGVHIQRLVLERDGSERDFRFRVVLTRSKRDDKVTDGSMALFVDGDLGGERVRLALEQLTPFPVAKLKFSFKHFQRLEGRLHLPERFTPRRVVVQVDVANSTAKPVRESFSWSVANS